MSTIRQPEGTTPSGEQPALCDGSGVLYSMRISEGDKPCPGCANCQQQPEPSAGLTPEREWASLITSFFDKHGYVSTVDSGLQTALDAARARIAELEADNRNVTFNNGELLQICEKHMAQIAEVERERDEWKKRCASDLDDAHRFREQAIEWKGKKEQAERDRDAALARAEKAEASHTEALDSLAAASERIAALESQLAEANAKLVGANKPCETCGGSGKGEVSAHEINIGGSQFYDPPKCRACDGTGRAKP